MAGAAVGTLFFVFWSQTLAYFVFTVASVILLSALLSPAGIYALIDRAFLALGQLLGQAVTWVLMSLIFYLFFLPFGVLLRRGRRDPMKRFYEPEAATYWSDRERARSGSASRRRQY